MLKKIEKIKLSEEVLRQLKEMIKSGIYQLGEKLPVEKQLAEIFGVSRATLREALAVLESEGWITTKHGGGTFIRKIQRTVKPLTGLIGGDRTDLLELLELRKILESEVATLAASRATTQDIADLNQAHHKMEAAISQGLDTAEADYEFHYALASATHNSTIAKVVSTLHDSYYDIVRTGSHHPSKPRDYERVLAEHTAILNAVENHQGAKAKKQMLIHLESIHRLLEEVLTKQ